jgi:hypothetical protein
MAPENQLAALNAFVIRAQEVLATYLPDESGKSEKEVISDLLAILDSREIHRLQKEIGPKQAFFSTLGD